MATARAHPEKYRTIIIDGMDQSKTNVPLLLKEAKSAQHLYRLRTHLSGAIIHTCSPHGKVIFPCGGNIFSFPACTGKEKIVKCTHKECLPRGF